MKFKSPVDIPGRRNSEWEDPTQQHMRGFEEEHRGYFGWSGIIKGEKAGK